MPPERDGEGQGRRATSLCPSCRPRSRTPQQGNRGAVDRVVPKDAVLQPLHQRRRYIRADKAHEARRRTATRFNAASPNVAQTYSAHTSLKRALRGRLIAEKGGPQRDWQAGWEGAHARGDDRPRASIRPPSARKVGALAQQGREWPQARRRRASLSEGWVVQWTLPCRWRAEEEREEGGMQQRTFSGDACVRPCVHGRHTPCATARPRRLPRRGLGRAMSDEGPGAAILAAEASSRMRVV